MAPSSLPRTPRSLADDLRARTPGQISRLLWLRPDLLHPWPADMSQLARRAADDASVLEAMQSLNTTALRVLEVYACLHEADAMVVAQGLPEEPEAVQAAVDELWSMALLWGAPGSYRITRAAQQAYGPFPCGLAAAGPAGVEPAKVEALSVDMDQDLLHRLVWSNPLHDEPFALAATRGEEFVLPREAALVLRGGMYLPPVAGPPEHPASRRSPGHSLWGPLAGVRYTVTSLAREAMVWHSVRGVSRRTLSERAERMAVPVEDLMAWLELAAGAGLIGAADDHLAPTAAADTWLGGPPSEMWGALIRAWLEGDRPLRACRPDELGVVTSTGQPRTAHHRAHILQVWPAHTALDAEGLTQTVAWHRPRMHRAIEQAADVYWEAAMLGLVEGSVTTDALVALPDVTAAALCLPEAAEQGSLVVQPDHTIVAPVSVDNATWNLIDSVSHVESWGPATVHRLDPARLRSAVSGHDPDELRAALARASRTPLPQSVEYAVRDAARGASARVFPATIIEPGEQDAQAMRDLGFQELTPQVFSTDQPPDVVHRRLAAAGIGTTAPPRQEWANPLDHPRPAAAPDPQAVTRLVAHLVGDDARTEASPPPLQDADPATMVDVCRRAIADDQRLWLRYSDGSQVRTEYVEPIELRSGRLTGWSLSTGRTVGVPISRIVAFGSDA
jgi:hypothetical protein